MKRVVLNYLVLAIFAVSAVFSCSENEPEPTLSIVSPALSFTAAATEFYDVVVTTNQQSWNATSDQAWCTIAKEANKFTVTVEANTSTYERTATITVSAGNAANVTVEVKQTGILPLLSVSPNNPVSFTKEGGESETITVDTNLPSWNVASDQTWCTIVKEANKFTTMVEANTSPYERTATITVSAGNAADVNIKAMQAGVEHELFVSPTTPVSFTKDGGTKTIEVNTNLSSWDVTSNQTWCMVEKGTNQFTITAAAYSGASSRTAIITVKAGNASDITLSVTQTVEPNIAFVARNPVTESLYSNTGFFQGSRINFDLIVYDAAGMTSITILETATGAPNGNNKTFTQTRVIPISGAGTYQLSQEILRSSIYGGIYSQFSYTVSAYGKNYTRNYSGDYSSYNGAWNHYFVIK